MVGRYIDLLESLCRRRGWQDPSYEFHKDQGGYRCTVLVNGQEYETGLGGGPDSAQEDVAMRAFSELRKYFDGRKESHMKEHTNRGHHRVLSSEQSSSTTKGFPALSPPEHGAPTIGLPLPTPDPSYEFPLDLQLKRALSRANNGWVHTFLQNSFADVATGEYEWLTELQSLGYSPTEIADILLEKSRDSPFIFARFEVPDVAEFVEGFHQEECVHSGLFNTKAGTEGSEHGSTSPSDSSPGVSISPLESIEYFCGIGGVKPPYTGDAKLLFGSLHFEDDNSTAISGLHDGTMSQVIADLGRAAGILQQLRGCCDAFSLLCLKTSYVELVSVDLKTLRCLNDIIRWDSDEDTSWDHVCRILEKFNPRLFGALGSLALAIQCLSLAFLSYSQAHCGTVRPFFLDTPLSRVILIGNQRWTSDFHGPCIVGSLVELGCFGDMLQQPVFAFQYFDHYDREAILERRLGLDLLASPEEVLDTWGPGGFMLPKDDKENLYAISIGGGLITPVATIPISLHWSPTTRLDPHPTVTFHRKRKIRIGAKVSRNDQCQAKPQEKLQLAYSMLKELGTSPSYWEVSERQLGIGLQAGQSTIALLQFNQTWVKRHGMTKKARLLAQRAVYVADLEGYFGIQVSVCTGIARRVRLRDLLSEALPAYVGALVARPPGWKSLLDDFNILEILKEGDLTAWLESLNYDLQKTFENLVVAILFILQDTGVDRKGENFIIGCIQPDMPFQCFNIPCQRENYWARMVADSEDIATFAYVTTRCLETDVVKCRGSKAHWANSTALLWTAVSCYEERMLQTASTLSPPVPWTLKHSEAYLVGKSEAPLFVQVERVNDRDEPRLLVSVSKIGLDILLRLYRKASSTKLRRLREKGAFNQKAENVMVLSQG
ncbi:hypothetical protein O1611_g4576 [Lasiodiplodia mahajangana]|uniref:Uncharacterized protein n=1 Tax=Lasiodiplodia mahajangana TaxID=1108764 RepID=A0ACC2JNN9_9PEZI|nr:hypothetical protein O1611_g4576 [Lasiodiplodia mahajangana]